tara:strand:+ start:181 stop:987 length:807 start_codon:yes stop_codon:yes gene_type:complete
MADFSGTLVSGLGISEDNLARKILTLDTITNFDDTVGDFDDAEGDFDLGGTDATSNPNYYTANIQSVGYYDYANTLTLDAIYDATFTIVNGMTTENEYDLFDSGRNAGPTGDFDDANGPFDGSWEVQAGSEVYIGASDSSLGAITTYQKIAQQTTIKGRYFKFRCKLTNDDNKTRPKVHTLSFTLALEKRSESDQDVVSTTSAKVITYTNPFYATPSVGVSAQGLATGDYYSITSKTKTGFTIQFFNSGASGISKTFDWTAYGYGLKS